MIKFIGTDVDGKEFIGFGLSDNNIELLKQDRPILVDGADLGLPNLNIVIMYGKTEEALANTLKEFEREPH